MRTLVTNPGFLPSDEQLLLRDSARRWASRFDPRHPQPNVALKEFAELGWLAAGLPESVGGLGGNAFDAAIIAEELGRALVRVPYVEFAVATAHSLLRTAPERVGPLVAGESSPLLVHEEAEARGDPTWLDTRAEQQGHDWVVTGRKAGILGAPLATSFLVTAVAHGKVGLFEVPVRDAPLRHYTSVDGRPCGELQLARTPARVVHHTEGTLAAVCAAQDHALVLESAEALGAMHRAFEITRDYLLNRRQYGQRIGDFQALRHRLADMFIELEQARSIVLSGLEALDSADSHHRTLMASATKARVAQSGLFVGGQAIQLHGGIGVTEEYPIGHYYKRLICFNQRRGSGEAHIERYATLSAESSAADHSVS